MLVLSSPTMVLACRTWTVSRDRSASTSSARAVCSAGSPASCFLSCWRRVAWESGSAGACSRSVRASLPEGLSRALTLSYRLVRRSAPLVPSLLARAPAPILRKGTRAVTAAAASSEAGSMEVLSSDASHCSTFAICVIFGSTVPTADAAAVRGGPRSPSPFSRQIARHLNGASTYATKEMLSKWTQPLAPRLLEKEGCRLRRNRAKCGSAHRCALLTCGQHW